MTDVHIVGVGIHPFVRSPGLQAIDLGVFALHKALEDAGVAWRDAQFVFGGSMDGGNADSVLRYMEPTGLQVINIINGCATGASSLLAAYWAIKSGEFDLGIAMGFDKHASGAFARNPAVYGLPDWYAQTGMMLSVQFFGMKIGRYMTLNGISEASLGLVAEKAFSNGALTPHAWRREPLDHDTIMNSPLVADPLRKFMLCSPGEGGVALVLASDRKMRELGLKGPKVRGAAIRTRTKGSFEVYAPVLSPEISESASTLAARAAFEMAEIEPASIDLAQLQDTDSGSEIMHLAETGFCQDGEQEAWLRDGVTRLGGRLPVNTDGGCLACGEPIGASGLRQIYENVQQLRGRAEARQVEGARLAFSHVYGAPGISGAVILEQ